MPPFKPPIALLGLARKKMLFMTPHDFCHMLCSPDIAFGMPPYAFLFLLQVGEEFRRQARRRVGLDEGDLVGGRVGGEGGEEAGA
jgi:hypothetical protein